MSTPDVGLERFAIPFIVCVVAIGAASSPGEPTGHPVTDLVFRAALAVAVTWSAARAPASVVFATTGLLGVAGLDRPLVGLGLLGAAGVLAVADWQRRTVDPALTASVGGLSVLGSFHLPQLAFFGGSALIGGIAAAVTIAAGLSGRPSGTRRRVTRVAMAIGIGIGVIAVGSAVSFTIAVAQAGKAQRHLRAALEATNGGQLDAATDKLALASADVRAARRALHAPWGRAGELLPIVAQHRSVAVELADSADQAVAVALAAARATDLDQLKMKGGRADIDGITGLLEPLDTLADSLDGIRGQLAASRPGWIVAPLERRIAGATDDLDQGRRQLANLIEVVRLAPDLLGGTADRRILVAFLTPSEARPLGGHMANYGELTISDGRLGLSGFGRASDLIAANADPATRVLSGPEPYLTRYGPFGAGGSGAPAGPDWWLDVTISPDFPSVAQVMSELYTNATGRTVDNVMTIDPTGLAGLLSITGPIHASGFAEEITADNVVQLLEHDQYALFGREGREERVEFLGDAGRATFDALLARRRLDPVVLVKHLAPAVTGGHLMIWSAHPAEQALFSELNASGGFTRTDTSADSLAVTSLNSGANKTDAFLTRSVRYEAVVDDATGELTGSVTVTLINDAPASGLPFHVIGNSVDEPLGSNRSYLTLYRGGGVTSMTVDGRAVAPATGTELGWNYAEYRLTLPPGSTTVVRYEVTDRVDPSMPYRLRVRSQPLANPEHLTVAVHLASGGLLASYDGVVDHTMIIQGMVEALGPNGPADKT